MADDKKQKDEIAVLEKAIQDREQRIEKTKADLAKIELTDKKKTIAELRTEQTWWSVTDAMTISSVVLIFGCIVMILATYLLQKGKNAEDVLKLFGTIIIVISAIFLVVAGYTDQQIAPVMGLLGTIAGYLLGRKTSDNPYSENKTVETKPIETKSVENRTTDNKFSNEASSPD